jgi:uncharacterized protein with HEPN domain
MVEAGESVARFVAGRRRTDVDSDEMLRFALVRAVEIIGEAASRVTLEGHAAIPLAPWPDVVFMRNRLIHAYFNVDHTILWKTATEEVPALLELLRPHLPEA